MELECGETKAVATACPPDDFTGWGTDKQAGRRLAAEALAGTGADRKRLPTRRLAGWC